MQTIDYAALEKEQKALLREEGSDRQREFIKLAANGSVAFSEHVLGWGVTSGEEPPLPPIRFTEGQFLKPPPDTEQVIAETWSNLSPQLAARAATWTRIHVAMVKEGLMDSSFLAVNGNAETGRARIQRALAGDAPGLVDQCVRAILRRLGGVIRDRGSRTAYIDCPTARAWWRYRFAHDVHDCFEELSVREISDVLSRTTTWEELIQAMVSRLTVIGDFRIRRATIAHLISSRIAPGKVRELLDSIGRKTVSQALGFLPEQDIKQIISD